LRTAFVGTSPFAAAVLDRLIASPHRPALVISRPDRPRGRGRRTASPAVVETARHSGIETLQPPRLEDATEALSAAAPDVVCVCAYGALIKEPVLSRFELLNVHPSLLPRWRGAAPIERAIMAGDGETGVSIMRVTAGLDSGPVGARQSEPIGAQDTYGTLAGRLAELGAELLIAVLDDPAPTFTDQEDSLATYAEKLTPADRLLDPQRPPEELERVVRALDPHIGAWIGDRLRVHSARPVSGRAPSPGELAIEDGRLLYGARGGALELLRVQPPGGRAMDAQAYVRGHAV
jgi:methionyl-tRNA formyltransferase